jgi:hypothetical protein
MALLRVDKLPARDLRPNLVVLTARNGDGDTHKNQNLGRAEPRFPGPAEYRIADLHNASPEPDYSTIKP